ncbi:hypothetical protein SLAVM298S_01324 [Streptomyces lavendulae subsp. lavendulae]
MQSSPATPAAGQAGGVQHVQPGVVDRPSDRDPGHLPVGVRGAVVVRDVDRGLGRPVQVDEPYGTLRPGGREDAVEPLDGRRRQGLAAAEDVPQGVQARAGLGQGQALQQVEEGAEHRGHEVQGADPPLAHGPQDLLRILLATGRQQGHGGALDGPPEQLPHRYVEGDGRLLQQDVAVAERVAALHPGEAVDDAVVLHHHALGAAGRPGGVDDVRQIAGAGDRRERGATALRQLLDPPRLRPVGQVRGGAGAVHDHHLGTAVLQQEPHALGGVAGIHRHVGATGLQDAEERRHQLRTALQHHRDAVVRADALLAQGPGDPVGPLVEFGVGQRLARRPDDGGLPGTAGGLCLEQPVQRGPVGVRHPRTVAAYLREVRVFGGRQHRDGRRGRVQHGHAVFEHGPQVARDRRDGQVLVEDVQGVVQVDAHVGGAVEGRHDDAQGVLVVRGGHHGRLPFDAGDRPRRRPVQVGEGHVEEPARAVGRGGQFAQDVAQGEPFVAPQRAGRGLGLADQFPYRPSAGRREPQRQGVGELAEDVLVVGLRPVQEGDAQDRFPAAVHAGQPGPEHGGDVGERREARGADPVDEAPLDDERMAPARVLVGGAREERGRHTGQGRPVEGAVPVGLGTGAVGGLLLDEREVGGGPVGAGGLTGGRVVPLVLLEDLVAEPVDGPAVGEDVVHLDVQVREVRAPQEQRGLDQGAAFREGQCRVHRAPRPLGARRVRFGLPGEVHRGEADVLARRPLEGPPPVLAEAQPEGPVAP